MIWVAVQLELLWVAKERRIFLKCNLWNLNSIALLGMNKTYNIQLRGGPGFCNWLMDALWQRTRRWSCGLGHLLPLTAQMTDGRDGQSSLACTATYSCPLRSFYFEFTVGTMLIRLNLSFFALLDIPGGFRFFRLCCSSISVPHRITLKLSRVA